ncbi:hypothetical protein ACQRXC_28790 (plasmid) [Niallia taxi]|uniref:Uncharacterized protein n=1 Tax=Niallia circulans TaxID=1397 RepID=A0A553SQL1_NIACI|nr:MULTISPECIES: hypothetical protein [Niallia]MED4057145.1 hypothetical protein [Niallia taxi]MED4122167.1 hypothetical protein [Niallia taxi]TRZ39280.1 hypothetical protein CEQ21_07890 [Niallia circulans]
MSFEANADRSINGIYSLIIGVAIGSILAVALPAVFESLVDVMNNKINTIGMITSLPKVVNFASPNMVLDSVQSVFKNVA